MPMRPRDISRIASLSVARSDTFGTSAPLRITSDTCVSSLASQRAAGMRARKVVRREAARIEQRHRERVAERQRRRGARGRREVERAGLLGHAGIEEHVRFARERRLRVAGDGDQLGALPLDQRQDLQQLVAFPGVGNADEDVVALDHAEVAVARLGGMHEIRRRAGARQSRSDLARDVAGLADAAHDDAALAVEDQRNRGEKALVQPRDQRAHRVRLDREHPARKIERGARGVLRYHGGRV